MTKYSYVNTGWRFKNKLFTFLFYACSDNNNSTHICSSVHICLMQTKRQRDTGSVNGSLTHIFEFVSYKTYTYVLLLHIYIYIHNIYCKYRQIKEKKNPQTDKKKKRQK